MEEAPVPTDEFERLLELSELDLDYTNLQEHLEDLTALAARIVDARVSLVNLIDRYTQWSVADYGIDVQQMPREDSVCQYTILEDESLEIKDLSNDERFERKDYVQQGPQLRYYYGVPLQTSNGANIGALCVLDRETKDISPENKELLNMIARQIVRRLQALQKINKLESKVKELNESKRKVSHDLRNPISGIIGLADLMEDEIKNEHVNEVLELAQMIKKGGNSLLDLVEEILDKEDDQQQQLGKNQLNCEKFREKLNELYQPQAKTKGVALNITVLSSSDEIAFPKARLLQIVGNLITNSIKFTPSGGTVEVAISVEESEDEWKSNTLKIKVQDTGVGMSRDKIEEILQGKARSQGGTGGEKGYGFGLSLVKHLVDKAGGEMQLTSETGQGTRFEIELPV